MALMKTGTNERSTMNGLAMKNNNDQAKFLEVGKIYQRTGHLVVFDGMDDPYWANITYVRSGENRRCPPSDLQEVFRGQQAKRCNE